MINNLGGFNKSFKDLYFINEETGVYFYNNVSVKTEEHVQKFYDTTFSYATEYNWMIKNYEDCLFEPSTNNFVIARDFLNLLCSRYKKWGSKLGWDKKHCITELSMLVKYWKQHVTQKDSLISYNRWTKDKGYRDQVSLKLGVENTIDNIDYVPSLADGSSFVGAKKETDSAAYEQRYKQIKLPEEFVDIVIKDTELLHLNQMLFDIDVAELLK